MHVIVRVSVAAVLSVALPAVLGAQARDEPARALASRVQATLGAAPADCGQFYIQEPRVPAASAGELRTALACVTEHAGRNSPAWMVLQRPGIDSWVAHGLMVAADGRVRWFAYDSDPSGGSRAAPQLTERDCPSARVGEDSGRGAFITCAPSPKAGLPDVSAPRRANGRR